MTGRKRPLRDRVNRPRLAAVAATFGLLIWGGCSVEKNYELLNFFFDGVPRPLTPEEVEAARRAGELLGQNTEIVSAHQAYLDRQCAACHGDQSSYGFTTTGFSDIGEGICADCHQETLAGLVHLHGPVAAGACLVCHQPHSSPYPKLLNDSSPSLCLGCHGPEFQGVPVSAVHEDLGRDCLECHAGHGGDNRFLLRPGWSEYPEGPAAGTDPAEPEW